MCNCTKFSARLVAYFDLFLFGMLLVALSLFSVSSFLDSLSGSTRKQETLNQPDPIEIVDQYGFLLTVMVWSAKSLQNSINLESAPDSAVEKGRLWLLLNIIFIATTAFSCLVHKIYQELVMIVVFRIWFHHIVREYIKSLETKMMQRSGKHESNSGEV